MASPTQVAIGAKHTQNTRESTAAPTQVTIGDTHTQNSTDTDTKKCEEGNGKEKGDDDGDDAVASPENLSLGCVSIHVEAIIISLSGTTEKLPIIIQQGKLS